MRQRIKTRAPAVTLQVWGELDGEDIAYWVRWFEKRSKKKYYQNLAGDKYLYPRGYFEVTGWRVPRNTDYFIVLTEVPEL